MAVQADQVVQQTVEHVLAVLRAAPPNGLPPGTQFGAHITGLLDQLPFVNVSAAAVPGRRPALGGTLDLKRGAPKTPPPGQPSPPDVDWGYVSGGLQPCQFTLSLWAITRPQLDRLRQSLVEIDWVGSADWTGQDKAHEWVDPPGTQNRTAFYQCRLDKVSASYTTAPAATPPLITVTKNNVRLRAGPSTGSTEVGTADLGAQFELLGRSADSQWVQGAWRVDLVVWLQADSVNTTVPLPWVPEAEGVGQAPAPAIHAVAPGAAATNVWRQDLDYVAVLELRQEPVEEAGERIAEIRITRQVDGSDGIVDVERTRLLADHEQVVEQFPP